MILSLPLFFLCQGQMWNHHSAAISKNLLKSHSAICNQISCRASRGLREQNFIQNGPGHMTNMVAMAIYGILLKGFFPGISGSMTLKLDI